jgi:hypothetical protein
MTHLRTILGYAWALMAGPIILATFMGMNFWAGRLVSITGLKVSPRFTGGEVVQTIEHERHTTLVHRPVFDGLLGERRDGFVQIAWHAKDSNLPPVIDEQIDFDQNGTAELRVTLDTVANKVDIEPRTAEVVGHEAPLILGKNRAVRIHLRKN